MPALRQRRRSSSSCLRSWRRAVLVLAVSLIPAMATMDNASFAQTSPPQSPVVQDAPSRPEHHPHRTGHPRSGHHSTSHGQAHHPVHPRQAPRKPQPVPTPVPVPAPHPVAPPVPANVGSNTGLPLPRYAALRADDVNMRSGPGTRYPILWLYKRRDLPVRVEREFDVWRLVEDSEGIKGWVHQATLVGTRSFVVTASGSVEAAGGPVHGAGTLLRDDPRDDAGIVAILRPGVIGRLRACPAGSDWCRVSAHSYSGWLRRSAFFGLLPNEAISPP